MKKLLLVFATCMCGFGAMAELPINFGIHGGMSSNRINFKDLSSIRESEASTGYMFGAFMRLNLGKLYLQPSLDYSHKTSIAQKNKTAIDGKRENIDIKMNTFDIPVMLGLNLLEFSAVKVRVFLGPQISVGKIKNLKELSKEVRADKTNLRGRVGIGLDMWKLTFDMDYEKGFQKLSHELKAPRSFNFTLGLKII